MKIGGAIFADFSSSFPGGASALPLRIGRRTIIGHTLDRFLHIEGLDARCVIVHPRDEAAARQAVELAGAADRVHVAAIDDGARPRRELIRAARKWSMDAWRGGLLGTTYFDEFVEPRAVLRAIRHMECDALLCLDGAMPVLDPALASAMTARQRSHEAEAPFVFTQAPPGFAGVVLQRELIAESAQHDLPIGLRLAYRPEFPQGDPINRPPCVAAPPSVVRSAARWTGDTQRSRALLAMALAAVGETADAKTLSDWLAAHRSELDCDLPREVEIELTTDDPLPDSTLRPRGARLVRRAADGRGLSDVSLSGTLRTDRGTGAGENRRAAVEVALAGASHSDAGGEAWVDVASVRRVAEELALSDDSLVVLGGHGDPLRHPQFGEIVRAVRSAGVFGIAVVSPLVELGEDSLKALREARVDVLHVLLDANTPETYAKVHGRPAFADVVQNIGRVEEMRRRETSVWPMIVPLITRCAATLDEIEAFYDRWIPAVGWATIGGHSRCGGLVTADSALGLAPPIRVGCRRLESRLTLLSDGTAVPCAEDPLGVLRLGDWRRESVSAIWGGRARRELRDQHVEGGVRSLPQLCAGCTEWHRC